MVWQTDALALAALDELEETTKASLAMARVEVKGKSRAVLLRDHMGRCNYAGYVLARVVDRRTEVVIYIGDADDWSIELSVGSVPKADRLFDDLFHDCPTYDDELDEKLRNMGFHY
jgi:hypothetical protein